jgi:NADH-quinone oxidoreductase subunit A
MLLGYLPILVLILLAAGFALVTCTLSSAIGPSRPNPIKLSPYECGVTPVGNARERFPTKFYLVAMLFIVFDIEIVFLYPWAVVFRKLGVFGLVEMGVFIGILLLGLAYAWRKRGLEW